MTRWWLMLAMCGLVQISAYAQTIDEDERKSHFGVVFTVSPTSSVYERFKVLFDTEPVDVRSRDIEIGGILRGRQLGGEWGISYVQKKYASGSRIGGYEQFCQQGTCYDLGRQITLDDVQLRGVMIHKFAPFATIKRRVQIGLAFGGGVAQARGTATLESRSLSGTGFEQATAVIDARDVFVESIKTIPIWRLEAAGAVLVAPGLKIRVGGGLDFTNLPAMSITAVYLIGSKI